MRQIETTTLRKIVTDYGAYLAVAFVLVIFVLFRWDIINVIWAERYLPPEPDDSFSYICDVRRISEGGYFFDQKYIASWNVAGHLTALPWKTVLALVANLGDFSYIDVYKANFFFGIILMAFTLLHVLKVLENDKFFWIFGIAFLTLYMGSGEYHGFYWVVPSFYSLAATFLLISLVYDSQIHSSTLEKRWVLLLFLITFLTIWSHPLGKFSYAAVVLSFFTYIVLNKFLQLGHSTAILLRKSLVIVGCGLIATFFLDVLPYMLGIVPSSYTLSGVIQQIGVEAGALNQFLNLYLNHFMLESYGFVLLVVGLVATLISKKIQLYSLFLSFFAVSLIAAFFSDLGYRLLVYLWPLTFIIYSYGCYFLVRKFIDAYKARSENRFGTSFRKSLSLKLRLNKFSVLLFFVILLISVNYVYPFVQENYDWNHTFAEFQGNRMVDWSVNPSIVDYINNVTAPGDLLIFADSNAFVTLTSLGVLDRQVAYGNWDWSERFAFLNENVNGSYLIATGTPKIASVTNITEAFDGKLTFSFIRTFGTLSVYHVIVEQTAVPYVFSYEDIDIDLVADDFQASFWNKTKNIQLVTDNETIVSGDNALRITLSQTEKGANDYIWHEYDEPQDWSDNYSFVFDWYGTGSGKKVELLLYAPDGSNRLDFTLTDDFVGWQRMVVPLNSFISRGNPSWSKIEKVYLRFFLDSPYTETFYIDRLCLDVEPQIEEAADVELISDGFQIVLIFLSFFVILLPTGLMWAWFIFRIRDVIKLLAVSFGLSVILIFLFSFILNLAFGLTMSKTYAMLSVVFITLLPLVLHYLRPVVKNSSWFSRLKVHDE